MKTLPAVRIVAAPKPHLTADERAELQAQQDMAERGRRLSAHKAATEGKVWCYSEETGEWTLETVMDGSPLEQMAAEALSEYHAGLTDPMEDAA